MEKDEGKRLLRTEILKQIHKKFGSQREFASTLGITEQNLTNKLSRLSSKFLQQIIKHGVDLRTYQGVQTGQINAEIVSVLKDLVKSQKENIVSLNESVKEKKEIIQQKDKEIQLLTKQLNFIKVNCKDKCRELFKNHIFMENEGS